MFGALEFVKVPREYAQEFSKKKRLEKCQWPTNLRATRGMVDANYLACVAGVYLTAREENGTTSECVK